MDFDSLQRLYSDREQQTSKQQQGQGQVDITEILHYSKFLLCQQNTALLLAVNVQNSVKNYGVMPDLSKSINRFSGEDSDDPKAWINTLESTANPHNWTSAFSFETARMHLVGASKHWFEGRQQELVGWTEFTKAF